MWYSTLLTSCLLYHTTLAQFYHHNTAPSGGAHQYSQRTTFYGNPLLSYGDTTPTSLGLPPNRAIYHPGLFPASPYYNTPRPQHFQQEPLLTPGRFSGTFFNGYSQNQLLFTPAQRDEVTASEAYSAGQLDNYNKALQEMAEEDRNNSVTQQQQQQQQLQQEYQSGLSGYGFDGGARDQFSFNSDVLGGSSAGGGGGRSYVHVQQDLGGDKNYNYQYSV